MHRLRAPAPYKYRSVFETTVPSILIAPGSPTSLHLSHSSTCTFASLSILFTKAMALFKSFDILTYLRTDKVQAYVADQIEESLLMVPTFQQLAVLSDVSCTLRLRASLV